MDEEIEYLKAKISHFEKSLVEVNRLAATSQDYAYSQRKVSDELNLLRNILKFIDMEA